MSAVRDDRGRAERELTSTLRAAAGWCAPSRALPLAVVEAVREPAVPSWWSRAETPAERRERERRVRWAEEDEWLRVQERLATTLPEVEEWTSLVF